jgi:beta-N-acetylglucosaminidase/N-acetyl-anhydromuramyl-L-alanine amidase AmpD
MRHDRRAVLRAAVTSLVGTACWTTGTANDEDPIPREPAAQSNYTAASRSPGDIDWIVLHTTGHSYEEAIATFEDPAENVSAHYVVGTEPGQLTNTVRVEDIAWGAGNGEYNDRSINVELVTGPGGSVPDQLYDNAARLVARLCDDQQIPRRHPEFQIAPCDPTAGSGGIIGHVQVPHPEDCSVRGGSGRRSDPGPAFEYDRVLATEDESSDRDTDSPAFEIGDDVQSTAPINVRSSAEITRNVTHTQPAGLTGTISNGYTTTDGFVWWWVHWENGVGGWSVQRYLDEQENQTSRREPQRISSTTDLRRRVDVTGEQLDEAIGRIRPDSPLIGLGDTWVATQEDTGIDALYQAAHAIWESGWGTSDIAQDKRNLYGFDARDACPYECANGFDSFEESIQQVMEYVDERYLSPDGRYHNGPHLNGMNVMYATDPNWASGITDVYNRLVEHLPESDEREQPSRGPETTPDRSDRQRKDSDGAGSGDSAPVGDDTDSVGAPEGRDLPPVEDSRSGSESTENGSTEASTAEQPADTRYADKHLACRTETCWTGFL